MSANDTFSFGQHKGQTFAYIAEEDPTYHVRYMAMVKKKGQKPPRVLRKYMAWLKKSGVIKSGVGGGGGSAPSDTRSRRRESAGDERFNFGTKRGQTFRQVAKNDPSYHLRCSATGYNPDPDQMARYREYFNRYGDQYAAARSERDAIGFAIGICPPDLFGQYDSD